MKKLTHISLCSGIGGIDLAAEWAGFDTVAQCEIDDYASNVLAKNFKGVLNLYDIRTVTIERFRECGINPKSVTLLSAGFPCQPYSLAGKGLGDGDSRDLWGEVARVIREVRPKWFVGENTRGLFARQNQRYFRRILADIATLGYSVAWGIWGACDVGAPHERKRVFIVAHAGCFRKKKTTVGLERSSNEFERRYRTAFVSDAACIELGQQGLSGYSPKTGRGRNDYGNGKTANDFGKWWQAESDVGRVVDGVSHRVDRLRCLGNAVVPQQVYPLLKAIADYENGSEL